jgi:uracil-DNA glycosylase family 4
VDDLSALKLQIEWGADEALEDAPVDRIHVEAIPRGVAEPRILPSPLAGGGKGEAAAPQIGSPAERAMQAAASANTLEELRAAIAAFSGCALRDTASHLVFAAGDPAADVLVIGDPPSADEDRSGTPFAGPAGAYLDRMLASIGLTRTSLLLTPLIPWRPPGDRPPNAAELTICLPFLRRLITLASPRRLLLLGPLPPRALLPQTASRRRLRGAWIDTTEGIPALPTFSPTELMRSPKDRRAAWADLRLLRRALDGDASALPHGGGTTA